MKLKEYVEIKYCGAVHENGYGHEGYERVLSYKQWFILSKISLTKTQTEYSKKSFDVRNGFTIADIEEYLDDCKEDGLTDFDFDYGHDDDNCLASAEIQGRRSYSVKKTEEELKKEYVSYISVINGRNQTTWRNQKREDDEYQNYLRLKVKYEKKDA